jgi:uncharacterized protein YggE
VDGAAPSGPAVRFARTVAFSAAADVPIEAGEVSAQSSVTITYAIAP